MDFQNYVFPEFQDVWNTCICKKPDFWKYGNSEFLDFHISLIAEILEILSSGNMEIKKLCYL